MDNSEITRAIIELALPHLDWQQLAKSDFNVGDAEALGRKFGSFYQGFYKGVLASLTEAEQIPTIETDEPKLEDVVSTKGGLAAPAKVTQKSAPKTKKITLNDVVATKGPVSRKKER